jgi:hypothetical protein
MSALASDLGQSGGLFAGLAAIFSVFVFARVGHREASTRGMRTFGWRLSAHTFLQVRKFTCELYLREVKRPIRCDR